MPTHLLTPLMSSTEEEVEVMSGVQAEEGMDMEVEEVVDMELEEAVDMEVEEAVDMEEG